MKLRVDQRFQRVSLDRFIECYFSEEFNNAVAPVSGLKSRRLVEERVKEDGVRERRVRMEPAVRIPAPIDRLVGKETISYDEVSSYDPTTREVRFKIESKAQDKLGFSGVIRFIADGDGVRRTIDGDITVKAPLGLGAIVERFITAETEKGYAKIAVFLQRWLDERAPPPATSRS